jgi:hypothetical protein
MKTVISNKTRAALELAKGILYSLKVITIGLFIPFLFVFGITYHTPREASKDGINNSKPLQVTTDRIIVDFNRPLSDQNG